MSEPIGLDEKFAGFAEHWRPKIVAQLNGQDVRLVKTKGVSRGTPMPMPRKCS